jgi:hypothetical protein
MVCTLNTVQHHGSSLVEGNQEGIGPGVQGLGAELGVLGKGSELGVMHATSCNDGGPCTA